MKIGIFSKFDVSGGSEFRCVSLANGLKEYTHHDAYLLSEKQHISDKVTPKLRDDVNVVRDCLTHPDVFYDMDHILVVNTDSKFYTTAEYWAGQSERHSHVIDLARIKGMSFLFNFIVSPARHLEHIQKLCEDVRIIPGNDKFFNEIDKKDKHEGIRSFPRMVLESPIHPESVYPFKAPSNTVRIGKHSKGLSSKWCLEHRDLILKVNEICGEDKIMWDFMGGSRDFNKSLKDIPNVITRKEFAIPVLVYLFGIDIFLFYPDWKRQEPWSRAVAEGLMSGCPVVATDADGGNRMQVKPGENGFLCKDINGFADALKFLIESPAELRKMGNSAMIGAQKFKTEEVVKRFLAFIE